LDVAQHRSRTSRHLCFTVHKLEGISTEISEAKRGKTVAGMLHFIVGAARRNVAACRTKDGYKSQK
jgi:hypothetical protein